MFYDPQKSCTKMQRLLQLTGIWVETYFPLKNAVGF